MHILEPASVDIYTHIYMYSIFGRFELSFESELYVDDYAEMKEKESKRNRIYFTNRIIVFVAQIKL